VVHGIQRHTTLQARRLIAQPRSHPGMRALMKAQRKDEQDKFENGDDKTTRLQRSAPGLETSD
jgi:hypothetical protein